MSVDLAPHVGPWTIEDVEALPDYGHHSRYELLTPGVLTVSPAPGFMHQRASRNLANLLEAAAMAAGVDVDILEAVNVEIPDGRLTQPDIVVVDGEYADTNPTRLPPCSPWSKSSHPAPIPRIGSSNPSCTPTPEFPCTGGWNWRKLRTSLSRNCGAAGMFTLSPHRPVRER